MPRPCHRHLQNGCHREALKKLLAHKEALLKVRTRANDTHPLSTERGGDYGIEVMGFGSIWQRGLGGMSFGH